MKWTGMILAGIGTVLSVLGIFKSTAVPQHLVLTLGSALVAVCIFAVLLGWKGCKGWVKPLLLLPLVALLAVQGIALRQELLWTFDCLKSVPQNPKLVSTFWYDQLMDYLIFSYSFTGLLVGSLGGILLTFKRSKNNEQKDGTSNGAAQKRL